MVGGLDTYQRREWSLQLFAEEQGSNFNHSTSYWTLLYELILRAIHDHATVGANITIFESLKSILNRLQRTTKTPLKHLTQRCLLRRIHATAGINIALKFYTSLSRLVQYNSKGSVKDQLQPESLERFFATLYSLRNKEMSGSLTAKPREF